MAAVGNQLTILLGLLVLGFATPSQAQDVFSGNDEAGQPDENSGGTDPRGLTLRNGRQVTGNSFCPKEKAYIIVDGHRKLRPGYFCRSAEEGSAGPIPIDANPCQPGGRGAYDWRNNAAGTRMPQDCVDYIASERRAGRSGMPTAQSRVRPIRQQSRADGLNNDQRGRVGQRYERLQNSPGVQMANEVARQRGIREVEFGNMKPTNAKNFGFRSNLNRSSARPSYAGRRPYKSHVTPKAKPQIKRSAKKRVIK